MEIQEWDLVSKRPPIHDFSHPLYRQTNRIFPGTLRERSVMRLSDRATETSIQNDMHTSGPLIEDFVDHEDMKLNKFTRKDGKQIFQVLRGMLRDRGRLGDPISNKELETMAIGQGFWQMDTRITLRDAWKQGLSRRFIRGTWMKSTKTGPGFGSVHGVHYILTGSRKNE